MMGEGNKIYPEPRRRRILIGSKTETRMVVGGDNVELCVVSLSDRSRQLTDRTLFKLSHQPVMSLQTIALSSQSEISERQVSRPLSLSTTTTMTETERGYEKTVPFYCLLTRRSGIGGGFLKVTIKNERKIIRLREKTN